MLSATDAVRRVGEDIIGAGLCMAGDVLGVDELAKEDREMRRTAITALPIVLTCLTISATGMAVIGIGRVLARPIDQGVDFAAEVVNIYREMTTNNEHPGKPFPRYEGPRNFVLRTALGLVASPAAVAARLVLARHRRPT